MELPPVVEILRGYLRTPEGKLEVAFLIVLMTGAGIAFSLNFVLWGISYILLAVLWLAVAIRYIAEDIETRTVNQLTIEELEQLVILCLELGEKE